MSMGLIIFLAVLVFVVIAGVSIYNRLVTLRNRYKNAFAQIDVQLKRRYDLIPNLVQTAKGYMEHERETLEAVIAARSRAVSAEGKAAADPGAAGAMKALMGAEAALTGALGKLLAVVESYPDLKADASMQQLMEELSSTENRVAFARQAYNDDVMLYNTGREQFPAVLLAGPMGFNEADLYELVEPTEREAPSVTF